ncbi:hypothetical protein [Nocardia sp. MW-W600-9]
MIITQVWEADRLPPGAVLVPLRDGAAALQYLDGVWVVVGELHPVELDQCEHLPARAFNVPGSNEHAQPAEKAARIVFAETTKYAMQIPWRVLLEELGIDRDDAEVTVDDLNNSMAIDALLFDAVNPDCADGSDRKVMSIEAITVHAP